VKRVLLLILPLAMVTGCGGKIATPVGQRCGDELRAAEKDYESVNTQSVGSSIELAKAANFLSQAAFAKQFEKFDTCIEKVHRARVYIDEAKKK